jgi:hypothetical protein
MALGSFRLFWPMKSAFVMDGPVTGDLDWKGAAYPN